MSIDSWFFLPSLLLENISNGGGINGPTPAVAFNNLRRDILTAVSMGVCGGSQTELKGMLEVKLMNVPPDLDATSFWAGHVFQAVFVPSPSVSHATVGMTQWAHLAQG